MLSRNKPIFLSLTYQRLFSGFCLKVSSMSSHSNNRRHRTSTSASPRMNVNKNLNQTNAMRRLFQPIDVKPMMMASEKVNESSSKNLDVDVGEELTGGKKLERSKFSIKKRDFSIRSNF